MALLIHSYPTPEEARAFCDGVELAHDSALQVLGLYDSSRLLPPPVTIVVLWDEDDEDEEADRAILEEIAGDLGLLDPSRDGEPRAILASDLHPHLQLAMLGRLAPHLWHGSEDD